RMASSSVNEPLTTYTQPRIFRWSRTVPSGRFEVARSPRGDEHHPELVEAVVRLADSRRAETTRDAARLFRAGSNNGECNFVLCLRLAKSPTWRGLLLDLRGPGAGTVQAAGAGEALPAAARAPAALNRAAAEPRERTPHHAHAD